MSIVEIIGTVLLSTAIAAMSVLACAVCFRILKDDASASTVIFFPPEEKSKEEENAEQLKPRGRDVHLIFELYPSHIEVYIDRSGVATYEDGAILPDGEYPITSITRGVRIITIEGGRLKATIP